MMTLLFILMVVMTTMTWSILSMNNPMNLSLIIAMLATMMSVITGLMMSSWYSLILFLIYIGGMMIMFSYFVSLTSNDPMVLKTKLHFFILPVILFNMINMQINSPMFYSNHLNNMYLSMNTITMLLILMILLIMMIMVIKLVKIDNAPLRGFNISK